MNQSLRDYDNLATKLFYFQYNHRKIGRLVRIIMRLLFSCDIHVNKMGGDALKHNGLGVVVSSMVVLGENCEIY